MKQFVSALIAVIISGSVLAQAPNGINYQGMARDNQGQPLVIQDLQLRVGILSGDMNGDLEYSETHQVTSNAAGIFRIVIGLGNGESGTFADIDWAIGPKFLKVELDPEGGNNYLLMGTTQLLTVPYAFYAEKAGNGSLWDQAEDDIFYDMGKVSIGSNSQEATSQVFISKSIPTDDASNGNGLMVSASDVVSRGFPLWIRSNTSTLTHGQIKGETMGRLLRLHDNAYSYDGIWDFGINQNNSLFISGGEEDNFDPKFLITNSGKVGVGTSNPAEQLSVAGIIESTTGGVKFPDGTVQASAASETVNLWNEDNDDIYFDMGKVSIGSSSQEATSQVFISKSIPTDDPSNGNGLMVSASDVVSRGFPLWIRSNTSTLTHGQVKGETMGRLLRLHDNAYSYDGIWDFGINQNNSLFITGGEEENFDPKFLITNSGKVGVGTSSPAEQFSVAGIIESTTGGVKFPDGTVQASAASETVVSLWNENNDDIYFQAGKVGVGTSNPAEQLSVAGIIESASGGVKFPDGTVQATAVSGLWNEDNDDVYFDMGKVSIGSSVQAANSQVFISKSIPTDDASNGNGLFVSASDVVSRGFPLWIRSNTSTLTHGQVLGETMGRLLRLHDNAYAVDGVWDFGINQNNSLFILGGEENNFDPKFLITNTGKVGIGTSSPAEQLSVAGIIESTTGGIKFPDGSVQTVATEVGPWEVDGSSVYYLSGSVGIGTNTPTAKMQISGGDLYLDDSSNGMIMKSPDGQCWKLAVDNSGNLSTSSTACP